MVNIEQADVRRAHQIYDAIRSWLTNDAEASRRIVSLMAESDPVDVAEAVDRIRTEFPAINDRLARMAACAERGLVAAEHLYGPARLLTHRQIRGATDEALALVSDPEGALTVARADGSTAVVEVATASAAEVRLAWDERWGAVPIKRQRRHVAPTTPAPSRETYTVVSAVADGDAVLLRLDGAANPVRLTRRDVANICRLAAAEDE